MGFLFSSKNKEKLVAIFHIGSGHVGGAIARIPLGARHIPTIIKSTRTDIAFHNTLDFNVFLNDMLTALDSTATDLYQSKVGAIDEIVCVLASPWYLSETRIIKMEREHPFTFTKRIADELFQKEISALTEIYTNKYGGLQSSPEVIENNVIGVSLNGYPVDDPMGKRTKSIEMNMIISLSPKLCTNKIKDVVLKNFHNVPVSFASFVTSSYLAVRDKFVSPNSYLLLDIGGEVTDVAIVTKGILKASLSFPFGKKTFYQYICTKQGIDLRDAKELFSMYSANTLSKEKMEKVTPLFKSIENSWGEVFRQSIDVLPRTLTLPNTIFLTADKDIRGWFANTVRCEEYIQSMVSERKCNVITLEGPEFLNMCGVKENACDPFLMIEAIAVMRKKEK